MRQTVTGHDARTGMQDLVENRTLLNEESKLMRKGTMLVVSAVLIGGFVIGAQFPYRDTARGAEAVRVKPKPEPVLDSMHELMEYVFEPQYATLKRHLAEPPEDNSQWKHVQASAFTLAEAGNLLLIRAPQEETITPWEQRSDQIRRIGYELFRAASKRDYPAARDRYRALLVQCNACHEEYAGGEHQLKP